MTTIVRLRLLLLLYISFILWHRTHDLPHWRLWFDPTDIEPTIYRTRDENALIISLSMWSLTTKVTVIVIYFIYIVNVIFTGGGNRYTEKITIVRELYLHLQRSTSDHIESEMISAFSWSTALKTLVWPNRHRTHDLPHWRLWFDPNDIEPTIYRHDCTTKVKVIVLSPFSKIFHLYCECHFHRWRKPIMLSGKTANYNVIFFGLTRLWPDRNRTHDLPHWRLWFDPTEMIVGSISVGSRSGQTKENNIVICCFSAKHAAQGIQST
jgi:hypothetical protein